MTRLASRDYVNIASFILMFVFVSYSYVSSDFFDPNFKITGLVVHSLADITYDAGYTPSSYDDPHIDDIIVFHIQIFNTTTLSKITDAKCNITIADDEPKAMTLNPATKIYTYDKIFTIADTYSYTINCDVKGINISDTNSITIIENKPDFIISINAPVEAEIGEEITINMTITNIGSKEYLNPIDYNIDYKTSTDSGSIIMSNNTATEQLQYTYSSKNNYTITATIDSNENIEELNETNNRANATISIINSTESDISCGNLTHSVVMTSNLYCEEPIRITELGVVLDCNNHRIYGDSQYNGIAAIYVSHSAEIKNCNIDTFSTGIMAESGLTLSNSTISYTEYGLNITSIGNSIEKNIFKNNDYAIINRQLNTISYNDFKSNDIHLNTTIEIDFKRNYFHTTELQDILNNIQNSTVIEILPLLNGSARDPDTGDFSSDIIGPNISYNNISNISDKEKTTLKIRIETDEEAECRYSTKTSNFSEMETISSSDNYIHKEEIDFYEELELIFLFQCKDLSGNFGHLYNTSKIKITRAVDRMINKVNEEINEYDETIEKEETKKEDKEEDLKDEDDQDEIDDLKIDIDKIEIEIDYYKDLRDNAENAQETMEVIRDKIKNIVKDHLEIYKENVEEIMINLTDIQNEIDNALDFELKDIDEFLSDKKKYIEDIYDIYDKNISKIYEKQGLLDDHLIELIKREKTDLQSKKERLEKLEKLEEESKKSIISNINYNIEQLEEDILEQEYDQGLQDLKDDLNTLETKLEFKEDFLDVVEDLIEQIEDILDYHIDNAGDDKDSIEDNLELLLEEVKDLKDDIKETIEALEDDIDLAEDKITDYKRGNISQSTYRLELVIKSTDTSNRLITNLKEYSTFINKLDMKVAGNTSDESNIGFNVYNNNPHNDTEAIHTIEWYYINKSSEIELEDMNLHFEFTKEYINQTLLTQPENIMLFMYNDGWNPLPTEIEIINSTYNYISIVFATGDYALGFVLNASTIEIINNQTKNESEINKSCKEKWICQEWSGCDLQKNLKTRDCIEHNSCNPDNTSKTEQSYCTEETCNDNIQNQDESGIDCGGVCPEACIPDIENPEEIPEDDNSKKNKLIMFGIFMILVVGIGTLATRQVLITKGKGKKAQNNGGFNKTIVDFICEKLFYYEESDKITQELVTQGNQQAEVRYYIQLVKYIFDSVEKNHSTTDLVNMMIQQGWNKGSAKGIVVHIAAMNLFYQIKEFELSGDGNYQDKEMVRDMFKTEGYEDNVIDNALNIKAKEKEPNKK